MLGLSERFEFLTAEARILVFSGILGGFTTFSAFAVETVTLLKRGDSVTAVSYVLLSVTIGIGALWLGWLASHASS
jgi:CrcB protein